MTARVLIVDDVPTNVKLLEARLSNAYFDVITAKDGPSALELLRSSLPDIVLLDVMMPGMDGFEVCKKIKSDPKTCHIPVVMVTALSETKDRIQGLEAGADDFLTKPISDKALLARVRNLTRVKMMMDAWRQRSETFEKLGLDISLPELCKEDTGKAKVLLVEDNPHSAAHIRETLVETEGDDVTIVADGVAGIAALREVAFELVILSLDLANEDALRLVAQIRAREELRSLAILVLVEEHDEEMLTQAFDVGVHDYLVRPLEKSELLLRSRTQIRHSRYQKRLSSDYQNSLALAVTDSLTGLYNRRYLENHLPRLLENSLQQEKNLVVMLIDIDHFKDVNDRFGHVAGDHALKEVSARIRANVRSFDLVTRLGGDEFVVVMPDCSLPFVRTTVERVRAAVSDQAIFMPGENEGSTITVSIGVAQAQGQEDMPEALLKRADLAMYKAKAAGRNKAWVADDDDDDGDQECSA